VVSIAVIASPFRAPVSLSVKFETRLDTTVPVLDPLATLKLRVLKLLSAGTGASFTDVKVIVVVTLALCAWGAEESIAVVTKLRFDVLLAAPR
jgi:hypothetical protein